MKLTRLARLAGQSIRKNKMRTLLTMLGVIIGVAAVIVMVAVGQGAQSQIRSRIDKLGTNLIVITAGSSAAGGVSQGAQTFNRLTIKDVEAIRAGSTLVTGVSPVIFAGAQVIAASGNWRTRVHGVSTDYATIRDWEVTSGALFTDNDQRTSRKVAVIGKTVADGLFEGSDPVGQTIQLRSVPFEVIGVLAAKGQSADGSDQDDLILAPYTTVQNRLQGHQFIGQIIASAANRGDIPLAEAEIKSAMRVSHRLGVADNDDFTVRDQTDLAKTAQETTRVMTWLLAAIASISLLVGGIGIMNIMLVSVTERTREIGIRMAVGARGNDVLKQFLVESTVMSVVGGLIGVAVGWLGALVLRLVTGWQTVVSPQTVIVALVFSATVGIFFGYYPASQAAKLDPIVALRSG
jgi:putative ABC transport system permease protein